MDDAMLGSFTIINKNRPIYALTAMLLLIFCIGFGVVKAGNHRQESTPVPTAVPGVMYFAGFPMSITLDGDFSDWNGIPYEAVDDGPNPPPNAGDNSVRFASVADAQNLYFSVLVTDRNIVAGQNGEEYWNEDSIEIYINATGNLTLTSYSSGVAQINIPAANMGKPLDDLTVVGINSENLDVRGVVVQTENGYAVEAAIPLATDAWDIIPSDGANIGFQLQVNSASDVGRDVKLSWSGLDKTDDQSYLNPSVFGQLVFTQTSENVPATAIPTVQAAVQPASGNFSVVGSTIYDPQGNEFITKGVNVNGYNWVWPRKTVDDINLIVDCWKFNLVRVNSFLFLGEVPYEQYTDNNNLDEIVNAFTARGIVVVFEAHDRVGSYYEGEDLDTLVSWFTDLANRYKDNPYVWFDVINEPGAQYVIDEANWLLIHQSVIRAIRDTAGANNIILVEGAFGGQDVSIWDSQMVVDERSAILHLGDEVMTFDGKTYSNIVFSIHLYDKWNYGDHKMANYFDRVLARDFALIVGEYGIQTNLPTRPAAESLFNTAVSRDIGRIVWQWDGSDDNDLTAGTSRGGGWEINDCQNPTNLSWLGQQVWNDNRTAVNNP